MKCVNCDTSKDGNPWGQWWHVRNYFGISGTFCPKCYTHIAHNSARKPDHPELYAKVKEKLDGRRAETQLDVRGAPSIPRSPQGHTEETLDGRRTHQGSV